QHRSHEYRRILDVVFATMIVTPREDPRCRLDRVAVDSLPEFVPPGVGVQQRYGVRTDAPPARPITRHNVGVIRANCLHAIHGLSPSLGPVFDVAPSARWRRVVMTWTFVRPPARAVRH